MHSPVLVDVGPGPGAVIAAVPPTASIVTVGLLCACVSPVSPRSRGSNSRVVSEKSLGGEVIDSWWLPGALVDERAR